MTSRRANGEGSIFPYRNGFAAYVWITTPSREASAQIRLRTNLRSCTAEWVELTRKAARGPVVTKVPTVGQFLNRWLRRHGCSESCPAYLRDLREPREELHRAWTRCPAA